MSNKPVLDVAPIPVSIVKSAEELTSLAVEFGSTSTFPVPLLGSAAPIQLLQRRPARYKSVIYVPSLVTGLATVTQIILGASTVAAYNPNSVGVNQTVSGGTVTAIAVNGVTTGATSGTFYVPAGGSITVTYTVAPTFTTAYPPGVSVASSAATGVVVAYRQDFLANPNNPQGFTIGTAPFVAQWENQQPLYAVALGSGPVNVSIIDQAQAGAQATAEEAVQSQDFQDESNQEEGGQGGRFNPGRQDANQY